ncbi:MAG: hypothetical protein JWL72_3952 [Ilumatobacteraceae bacterium]|nr:hypothetical protein [Ilumatobacteraceae bacterium]
MGVRRWGVGWAVISLVAGGCSSEGALPRAQSTSTLSASATPESTGSSDGPAATIDVVSSDPHSSIDTAPVDTASSPDTTPDRSSPDTSSPLMGAPDTAATPGDPAAATRALFVGVAGGDPGCSVAVGRDGQVVFADAFGAASLTPNTPMSPATVVDIGSTSKQFTATAIALLSERGDIDLDDAISVYVPGLPDWAGTVTLREMLHHTSGIPDYIGLLSQDYSEPATDADALNAIAQVQALDFEPGTSWAYSNSNYFLLGQVVLEMTGDDLGRFLTDEVFGPLHLDAVMDPTADIAGKAVSYERAGGRWVDATSPWTQTGDGGVQTTPSQLVKWAAQYWAPTIGDADINILRLDGAVDTDDPAERYGFGIFETTLDGEQILEHSGSWEGFATSFVVAPDRHLAVAVTCTSNETVPDSDNGDIGFDVMSIWLAAE